MCEPCMPAVFLLAVCNFKGFPALKPRQVPWAALKPAFPGLLILNMALPTSQAICFQCAIYWRYVLTELLKILKFFMSLINMWCCFPPSLTFVVSPVREICASIRYLKYFDRVFVSVSSIKVMWWQADSKKRFAPNVLELHFSSSLPPWKLALLLLLWHVPCLKKKIPPWLGERDPGLPSFWAGVLWQESSCGQEEMQVSLEIVLSVWGLSVILNTQLLNILNSWEEIPKISVMLFKVKHSRYVLKWIWKVHLHFSVSIKSKDIEA